MVVKLHFLFYHKNWKPMVSLQCSCCPSVIMRESFFRKPIVWTEMWLFLLVEFVSLSVFCNCDWMTTKKLIFLPGGLPLSRPASRNTGKKKLPWTWTSCVCIRDGFLLSTLTKLLKQPCGVFVHCSHLDGWEYCENCHWIR